MQREAFHQSRLSKQSEGESNKQSMTAFEAASENIKNTVAHPQDQALNTIVSQMEQKNSTAVGEKQKARLKRGLKRSYDQHVDSQHVHTGAGIIQLQTPFETPESSQVTLPLDRDSITGPITNPDRRKKHRNNLNPVMTESLKSLFPTTQDNQPLKTLNGSEERVFLYDNHSDNEMQGPRETEGDA